MMLNSVSVNVLQLNGSLIEIEPPVLPDDRLKWSDGIAYRVIRADQAHNGLAQGGIRRDGLMSAIQRLGL